MNSTSQPTETPFTPSNRKPDSTLRILFLDDDHDRAEIFLAENPGAVWVETVEDCLARLEESWDEVHLDHDLGGERFVECDRDDCGMAIVRWLCQEPRPHLGATRFFVHSHNRDAANLMVMQMFAAGFQVEGRPFGSTRDPFIPFGTLESDRSAGSTWVGLLRGVFLYLGRRRSRGSE